MTGSRRLALSRNQFCYFRLPEAKTSEGHVNISVKSWPNQTRSCCCNCSTLLSSCSFYWNKILGLTMRSIRGIDFLKIVLDWFVCVPFIESLRLCYSYSVSPSIRKCVDVGWSRFTWVTKQFAMHLQLTTAVT